MLPAILRWNIPGFASANERVLYEDKGNKVLIERLDGVQILADSTASNMLRLRRVK